MAALDFLYAFMIAPLRGAMEIVLDWAHALTGSWGWSIVLLSLAVNIALLPVYHLAESWQEDERGLQRRMAGKLAEIKAVYGGRERYMFTRAVYRMFGYHPLMALRTSLGLLIQIPFFFAAYNLLHGNAALEGAGFFFISNLGQPDALLSLGGFSANLLPFVMTAVNLASAAVYSARLTRRDKIQLYGLAALFLLLLYTAAAGLLLYWTCNNIFSFFKNIYYRLYVYEDSRRAAPATARAWSLPGVLLERLSGKAPAWGDLPAAALAVALLLISELIWRRKFVVEAMVFACAAVWLAAALRMAWAKRSGDALLYRLGWLFFLFSLFIGLLLPLSFSAGKYATARATAYSLLYSATLAGLAFWIFSRQPLCVLVKKLAVKAGRAFAGKNPAQVFTGAVLLAAALIFLYEPSGLFASDPALFFESKASMFGALLFKAAFFCALAALAWKLAHTSVRPLLSLASGWWALCMAVYSLAVFMDYGQMDGPTLSEWERLYWRGGPAVDAAVLVCVLALILLAGWKRRAQYLSGALQGLAAVLCLLSCWTLLNAPPQPRLESLYSPEGVPAYAERLFNFSAGHENVVVFMLDSFTGSHLGLIFQENPELAEKFAGFTWYSDTLAPGNSTATSLPAMLGGPAFAPQAASEKADRSLRDRAQEAYAVLPGALLPQGYDVAMTNVEMLDTNAIKAYCPRFSELLYTGSADYAFINAWRARHGLEFVNIASQSSFMASFGLFKVAPLSLRRHIYRRGTWLQTYKIGRDSSEGAMAMLDLLTPLSRTAQDKPTFKLLTSMLPHDPWQLDAECRPTPSLAETRRPDGLIAEYVNAERCSLVFIGRWLDWLRSSGIFENSKVIILSDHSNSNTAPQGVGKPGRHPARPDALLLVKDFGGGEGFKVDDRPMSAGDLAGLICRDGGRGSICGGVQFDDPLLLRENRLRHHFQGAGFLIRRHRADSYQGILYSVQGSQFSPSNWKVEKIYE